MTSQQPSRRLPLAAAVCAALLFALPACAQTTAAAPAAVSANEPAKVEKNAATGIAKLTLTEKGIERLDLKTDTVKAGNGERTSSCPTPPCSTTPAEKRGCTPTRPRGSTSGSRSR